MSRPNGRRGRGPNWAGLLASLVLVLLLFGLLAAALVVTSTTKDIEKLREQDKWRRR